MTHHLDDEASSDRWGDRLRVALLEAPQPAPVRADLAAGALREGRRRVHRRRVAGVGAATVLSCAAAATAPTVLTALDRSSGTRAAGQLWAEESSAVGAVVNRLDPVLWVGPGPDSPTSRDGDVTVLEARDWTVSWMPSAGISVGHDPSLPEADRDRHLVVRVASGTVLVHAAGGGRPAVDIGSAPITGEVTGISVRLADEAGWVGLVVTRAALADSVMGQVRLRAAGVWADASSAADTVLFTALANEDGTSADVTVDPSLVVGDGAATYRLSAVRLKAPAGGQEQDDPFDAVAAIVAGQDFARSDAQGHVPADGSAVRHEAAPVVLVER